MKTRLIANLTALTLTALAGTQVRAEDAEVTLAWQQPGYVMDVVVVTAPRPETTTSTAEIDATSTAEFNAIATEADALAWQQPGYVEEVVVVTASRSEILAKARRAAIEAALARDHLRRSGFGWNGLGAPSH